MPVYRYTAMTENGSRVRGEGVAMSPQQLQAELTGQGLLVQSVRPQRFLPFSGRGRRVRPDEFLLFNQEMIALLRAGLTVPEALRLAADRPDQPVLASALHRVEDDVRQGVPFSEACARHPALFEGLYLAALRTGEKTGNFATILAKYQEALRHRVALHKKVSQALAYPLFLLITLGVILAVLFVFVLPRFVAIYADFGAQLPFPTRVLMTIVDHLPVFAGVAAALGVAGVAGWRRLMAREATRLRVDDMKTRLPVVGPVYRLAGIAQIARTLSALLAGGVPLVEAMRMTKDSLANCAHAAALGAAARQVTEGASLTQALRASALMPGNALKMIEVGEASGTLDQMLAEVAGFYEDHLSHVLARMMSLIEPVMMLLMGILVGGTIIVMYLPVFHIADVIK
jgi:type IV pilus assembly protein PilC